MTTINVHEAKTAKPGKIQIIKLMVGGATLQSAVGVDVNEIKSLGQWTTDCYKRYVKMLSREEIITSLLILELQTF
ncbi:hypothetical protein KEM48_014662 [Puccinia striiformis f. sp. tritici PST-130]|nr:hypothetical protein KEM48_014662 [Puccinia striiformis f. sp. tritici PST-130]